MPDRPNKRRKVVVDAEMQFGISLRLIAWLYLYLIVFSLAANAGALVDLLTADAATVAYTDALAQLGYFVQFTLLPMTLVFVVIAGHGVLLTHRVAGPVHRFKQVLADMARRRFDADVRLRGRDYLQALATQFNATQAALREDAARQHRMNRETIEAAAALLKAAEQQGPAGHEIANLAHVVLDRAERLERHVAEVRESDHGPERVRVPEVEMAISQPITVEV